MLVTAVLLGLLSSFHCLGMCGPIAFALPVDRQSSSKATFQTGLYHLGRLMAYASIGAIFGWIGKGLYLSGFQQRLSILIGFIMILLVIVPIRYLNRYRISQPIYRLVGRLKSKLRLHLNKSSYRALLSIGFFNGFLPCGMVYIALVGAIVTSGPLMGATYMLLFGLGTIPVMSLAVFSRNLLSANIRRKFSKAVPVFIVLLGLLFILRGMGLGVPYISPKETQLQVTTQAIECID